MSFNSWLQNFRSALAPGRGHRHRGQRVALRAATHRLNLEVLEDRRLLALIAPVDYAVDWYYSGMNAGDFNGDAVLDLVALNSDAGTVGVLLGNANGTFQPAQTSAAGLVGGYPQSVAVGDLNADGKLDLVLGDYNYDGTGANDVNILFGHGDGTFDPAVPVAMHTWGAQWYVVTGDLNADGKLDLVVTSNPQEGSFGDSTMRVLLGHGDGTFTPAAYYRASSDMDLYSPVLADFDGDGNTDVAVPSSSTGAGLVEVFLGNGDGALQSPRSVVTYLANPSWYFGGTFGVTVGDFNGDNSLDMATINYVGRSILLGNGDGTFQPAQSIAAGGIAGDFDGDGALDLVDSDSAGMRVFLGNGDGSFAPPIMTATESYPYTFVAADFNGDGRPDVAATGWNGTVGVLLNDGNWSSQPPVVGDLNGDGEVNIFDVNLVSAHWGEPGPAGDANGDGLVNIFDINLISANWSPIAAPPESGSRSHPVGVSSGGALRVANSTAQPTSASSSNLRSLAIASRLDKGPVGTNRWHTDHAARSLSRLTPLDALDAVLALENFDRFEVASLRSRSSHADRAVPRRH
jgi:FG-GAP-like repeat/Dockerin type I domain